MEEGASFVEFFFYFSYLQKKEGRKIMYCVMNCVCFSLCVLLDEVDADDRLDDRVVAEYICYESRSLITFNLVAFFPFFFTGYGQHSHNQLLCCCTPSFIAHSIGLAPQTLHRTQ